MIKELKYKFIDISFWVLLILFSNPGGILQAIGLMGKERSGINITDVFFVLISACFFLLAATSEIKIDDKAFKKIINYLILFGLYYFLVFGFITPSFKEVPGYSLTSFLIKSRHVVYSFLLFFYVYFFFVRSASFFYKFLLVSSILILIAFIFSIVSGVEILPIQTMNRRFVKTERIFLLSYGFMFLLTPMGSSILVFFKHKFKWKKWLIMGFLLIFLAWIFSITRRRMLGVIITLILASVVYNYLHKKPLIPIKKILSLSLYIVIFGFFTSILFPKYADAGYKGIEEAFSIATTGKTSSGTEDARMGLGKEFMQNLIIDNPYFGTGFDNRWRTLEGDEQGYEASDYPFIGAVAMTGIFGILFFLPVYVVLIKCLIYDLKYLRNNSIAYQSFEVFTLLTFVIHMLYDLLQYMNLFLPVALSGRFNWYVFLSMYLASRKIFYDSLEKKPEYA